MHFINNFESVNPCTYHFLYLCMSQMLCHSSSQCLVKTICRINSLATCNFRLAFSYRLPTPRLFLSAFKLCNLASIPGRVFAFLTVIKAKTRPGIEAMCNLAVKPIIREQFSKHLIILIFVEWPLKEFHVLTGSHAFNLFM